jgi:ribonuclease PH
MSSSDKRTRPDGRTLDALRPVEMTTGFHRNAEGSVLYRAGSTVVLCTASVDDKVPPFLEGKGKGWITAEYQMHPRASPARRESRDGRGKAPSGRTLEIQRLAGRALRAAVALEHLGERTITVDCDVLEADGGTRTASVTGGFVALALALAKLHASGKLTRPVLREPIAATSVGYFDDGALALDLMYLEDSTAGVDLNVVATASGAIVEVQGTAEGAPVARATIDRMMDLALVGIARLGELQVAALARAGVDLKSLRIPAEKALP